MRRALALAALATLVGPLAAQAPIGPFAGHHAEGFDGPAQTALVPCLPFRVFDATADVCTPGFSGCQTSSQMFFACLQLPASPPHFFASVDGAVEIAFDHAVERFGGSFAIQTFFPDAQVEFLDGAGNVVATALASVPADCQWHWQGWDLGPASSVRRIVIRGSPIFNEGFVGLDDLQVDYAAGAPLGYCTPGTTSGGCSAAITASGNPDVSGSAPCAIAVSGVDGGRIGLVFYGVSGANASPWCAGGTSLLCVKAPTQRTPLQPSGGTLGACDGTFALDWTSFHASHPAALGAPWTAHERAWLQAWFRDPPSCKTTSLSDALVLTYQP